MIHFTAGQAGVAPAGNADAHAIAAWQIAMCAELGMNQADVDACVAKHSDGGAFA